VDISHARAEQFLMFCMLVAGKRSDVQRRKLTAFLRQSIATTFNAETVTLVPEGSPFDWIRKLDRHDSLEAACRKHRLGKYSTLVPGFRDLARSDVGFLNTDKEELQKFSGIGPKTSQYFLMRTGQLEDAAALDTHILSWLQEQGYDAPDETPPAGPEYERLQDVFVKEAEKRDITPSELDAKIWNDQSDSDLEANAKLKE